MSILISVVDQKMYVSSTMGCLVSGSQEFVRFRFNLSEDWDGLLVFAQFKQNGIAYNQYLDTENSVFLPAEIKAGTCTMMLYGSNAKTIATTNYITFTINEDILISDAQSTNISESLYNQLVTNMQGISERLAKVEQYTGADKEEIVNGVLSSLPIWTGGSY